MASRVAVLIVNNILPVEHIQNSLEEIGFSCIVIDSIALDIELPTFNVCIVGVVETGQKDRLVMLSKKYPDKPFLYYADQALADRVDEFEIVGESNIVYPDFTNRELGLAIELTSIKRKQAYASAFSDRNSSSNHVRLKNIISEEQAWRILFEQSPNGILLGDDSGNILYTNQVAGEMLGYDAQELIRMQFHDLVSEELKPLVDANIQKIISGESLITEVYNYRKDGCKRYIKLHEARVIFPNGNFGILDISTDISRAKEAEEALLESMGKYQVLVERSNDGIIYAKDGLIIYGNPKIMEMLATNSNEFIGKPISTFLHSKVRDSVLERYARRVKGKEEPSIYETLLINSKNEPIPVEFNVNLTRLKDETITIVFVRDISKRKQIEKAVRESEESYRGLFDNASEAISILDSSGVFLDVNFSGQKMYGYTKDEIVGLTIDSIAAKELNDLLEIKRRIKLAYQGHSQTFEFWGTRKDGQAIPNEVVLSKGTYFGLQVVMAMARDISERKNAEAILKESEDKYRSLTEEIPIGMYRLSPAGDIIYSNPAFATMMGFSNPNELIGQNIGRFSNDNLFKNTLFGASEEFNSSEEILLQRADGVNIWVRNQTRIHCVDSDTVTYLDGVMFDISDRKLAIDALQENEAKFRAMVVAIPDQLFRITGDGTLVDFAPTDQLYYPKLTFDMIGKPLGDYIPNEVFLEFANAVDQCKSTNLLQTFEYRIDADSKTFFYESRIIAAGNETFLVLQRDITQRKKAEEDLKMLAQAIMNANDSITITDLNNKIIFVNPAFSHIYGYSHDEIIGKNTAILKPLDVEDGLDRQIMAETMKSGWQGELINVKKDGSVFPISLSTSSVYDDSGNPIAMVGISNDITERKRIEQELIRAKEKAEESDKLKTAFLSNMSHEIRSPMNAVLGFIQLLKDEELLSESGQKYIELIQNSGNQLLSLIEDIIDISKIQANQLRILKSPFDLNQCMEDLYSVFSSQLKYKSEVKTMLFQPELANPSPFNIYSDPLRIKQILSNLLSNAVKFTPSGSIKFGYTLIIDDYSPKIKFFVKDSGIGISPENQMLIFERFRQADDSYTRLYGGSGLGLAISKGLVELLGGHIWLESQPNEGSEFFFTIPFVTDEFDNNEKMMLTASIPEDGEQSLSGRTILIVEDTKDIRLYFESILSRAGARIFFATTAKEARKIFRQEKNIDLVLLDIRLPDSDGYNLALEFKRARPHLPIIAQTAYALQSELNKSIASGCDDYITKPLDSEALYSKIHRLLDESAGR